MAAAYALAQHPDKFQVYIFDKQNVCGGMATSSSYVFTIDCHLADCLGD